MGPPVIGRYALIAAELSDSSSAISPRERADWANAALRASRKDASTPPGISQPAVDSGPSTPRCKRCASSSSITEMLGLCSIDRSADSTRSWSLHQPDGVQQRWYAGPQERWRVATAALAPAQPDVDQAWDERAFGKSVRDAIRRSALPASGWSSLTKPQGPRRSSTPVSPACWAGSTSFSKRSPT